MVITPSFQFPFSNPFIQSSNMRNVLLFVLLALVQGESFNSIAVDPTPVTIPLQTNSNCRIVSRPPLVPGQCDYLENRFSTDGCILEFVCKVCPVIVRPEEKFGCKWILGREQDTGCPQYVQRCGGEACKQLSKPFTCDWNQVHTIYDNKSGCPIKHVCKVKTVLSLLEAERCPAVNMGCVVGDSPATGRVDCTQTGTVACRSVAADYCGGLVGFPPRRTCCIRTGIEKSQQKTLVQDECVPTITGCIVDDQVHGADCTFGGDAICGAAKATYCGTPMGIPAKRVCCIATVKTAPIPATAPVNDACSAKNSGCVEDDIVLSKECTTNGSSVCEQVKSGAYCGAPFTQSGRRMCCTPQMPHIRTQRVPRVTRINQKCTVAKTGCMIGHVTTGLDCTVQGVAMCQGERQYCGAFIGFPQRRQCCTVTTKSVVNVDVRQQRPVLQIQNDQQIDIQSETAENTINKVETQGTPIQRDEIIEVVRDVVMDLLGISPIRQDNWQLGNLVARPRKVTIRDEANPSCPSVCLGSLGRPGCTYKFGKDNNGCQTVELNCEKADAPRLYDQLRGFSPRCPAIRMPTLPHEDCVYEYVRGDTGCIVAVGFECPRERKSGVVPAEDVDPTVIRIAQDVEQIDIEMQKDDSVIVTDKSKGSKVCMDLKMPAANDYCIWVAVINNIGCVVDYKCTKVAHFASSRLRVLNANVNKCPPIARPVLPTDRSCRLKYIKDINNCITVSVKCDQVSTPHSLRKDCPNVVREALPHPRCRHVFGIDSVRCPIVSVVCEGVVVADDVRRVCTQVSRPPLPGHKCRHVFTKDINGCEVAEVVCDCESVVLRPLRGANCFHVYLTDGIAGCPVVEEECACPPTTVPVLPSKLCRHKQVVDQATGCAVIQVICGNEICEPVKSMVRRGAACTPKIVSKSSGCPIQVETCDDTKTPLIRQSVSLIGSLVDNLVSVSDSNGFCCLWASMGECDKNPMFMRSKCQRSCGTIACVQENALNCKVYTNINGCPWDPKGSLTSIGSTNVVVREVPDTKCHDSNTLCNVWSSLGDCGSNPLFMRKYCKRACSLCFL